jgi:hypothetical protein
MQSLLEEYFAINKLCSGENIPSVSGQTIVVVTGVTGGVVNSLYG